MKKPAPLSAGLVASKGAAAPVADMPTRSPAAAAAKAPKEPSVPINFKMSDAFVLAFKSRAVVDRLKLNELLELCFEAYCEKHDAL